MRNSSARLLPVVFLCSTAVFASTPAWVDTPIGKAVRTETAPRVVTQVNPRYPGAAVRFGTEGLVRLDVLVDQTGKVLYSEVMEATTCELGNEAKAAVERWVFTPTVIDGKAVPVMCPVTIRFKMP